MRYATIGYALLVGAMSAAPSYGKVNVDTLVVDLLIDGEIIFQNGVSSSIASARLDSNDRFIADGEARWNCFPDDPDGKNRENLEARFEVKYKNGEKELYHIVDGAVEGKENKPLDGIPEEGTKTLFENGEEVSREKLDDFLLYRLYEWFVSKFRLNN